MIFESIAGVKAQLIAALVIAALVILALWRFAAHFDNAGYQRAAQEYEARIAKGKEESLLKERGFQAKVDEAEKKGYEREKQHKVIVAVLNSRVSGLRNDIANFRSRLPEASGDACIKAADTAAELFGACVEEYRAVADEADRIQSDKQTLIDAWLK